MGRQRNVQQQAAERREAILRAVALGAALPPWLRAALERHDFSPQAGLLVRHVVMTEQEGDLHAGTWLTDSAAFWEIEVMVCRDTGRVLHIEPCVHATAACPAVANLPGTGPSFGYLAREVLREKRAG